MALNTTRLRAALAAVLALPALFAAGSHDVRAEEPADYPGGTWEPRDEEYGVHVRSVVMVPMDDGVDIRVQILRPTDLETGEPAAGPFPVLITQTPYSAHQGAQRNVPACDDDVPDNPAMSTCQGDYFVRRGYILVVADQRGTGLSGGGEWDMFGRRQGRDGANLALWAADPNKLKGSAGVVGLWGCSAMGISQLTTAAHLGRELGTSHPVKAMAPGCISGGLYRDSYFDNGVPGVIAMLTNAEVATSFHRIPLAVAEGKPYRTQGAEIMTGGDMAYERAVWRERRWTDLAPAIVKSGVPALLYNGWAEGITTVFDLYAQLQNASAGRDPLAPMTPHQPTTGRYQFFVGEGGHGCCLGDVGTQLQWYDHWLKGEDTGLALDTKTPLHLQDAGSHEYVNLSSYPITDDYSVLRLGDGTLGEEAPADGKDALVFAYPVDGVSSHTYDTAALTDGATLAGPMVGSIYASSSNSNLQLAAGLYDVAPDGTAVEITHGTLVASLSDLDPQRTWTDRDGTLMRAYPRFDFDRSKLAKTINRYDINLPPKLHRVAPGHKLRLTLASQWGNEQCARVIPERAGSLPLASPYGCFNTVPQQRTLAGGQYKIHRTAAHPSALHLPLLAADAFTAVESSPTPTSGTTVVPKDWGRS